MPDPLHWRNAEHYAVSCSLLLPFQTLRLFIINKRVSGKSGWKVDGTRLFGRSSGKFPGATERLKRLSCFSGRSIPNGNLCSISSKQSLTLVSGLRGHFSVNGTDLYKW